MEEFQLSKFTKEGAQLLREVTEEFNRLGIDAANLPKNFPDDDGKIKLVFVGQYSAGKSSIIKMLTGEDVAIGAAITTQDSTPYEWNGLEIIDTPGIHTELRPDHDEITYDQINHAALLIFVITNEGFSQRMGDHFRELAIDQKRAANMVLVVNKMDRTALGNVPEQQEVIYEDLKKVTAPHDPKELYLSFLDTTSWFDSLEESDAELKAELFELSGHDIFVANLNRFVAEKGVLQKINLPLNTIAAEIRKASGGMSDDEKKTLAALVETLRERKNIFLDGQDNCKKEVAMIITRFKGEINNYGLTVAENILKQSSKEDAEKIIGIAQRRIEKIAASYATQIDDCTKNFVAKVEDDLKDYEKRNFFQKVNLNLQSLSAQGVGSSSNGGALALGGGGLAAGALLAQYGGQLAQFAIPAITPLGNFVGNAVKIGVGGFLAEDAGIFSGFIANQAGNFVKALPFFQAELTTTQRIAAFIAGNARLLGAGLAVAGAVLSMYMTYRDGEKAKEREREYQKAMEEIRENFSTVADNVGEQMQTSVNQWLEQNSSPVIATFDEKIKAVDNQTASEKIKSEKLAELLTRTENLIGEIQACK
ncbi:MAG: GTPase domain-containing protein [Selenomonadaceae bacterium]|nr:GTPase domain-containing protein [Selenomonadaceae bacterium]